MVSRFSMEDTQPEWALAYRWDIVLRGRGSAPFEAPSRRDATGRDEDA